jgi:asparagine synthase (glutamine-hydrolysing)
MSGINGILAYHSAADAVDAAEMIRTRDYMAARGPDGMGTWMAPDGRVGLGHRRLAVVDISDAGTQPMASADGRLVVILDGAIYNHRQLRGRLKTRGYAFRTRSDTEVLLHLYAQKGEAMVHDLRGMFALAIWDGRRRSLLLARDPYGIKPLYYCDDGRTFRFASQVKALLAGGAVSHEPDAAGQAGFYLFGNVPEPFTTYREIRSLPAGTTMRVDRSGAQEPRRYHSIAQVWRDAEAQPRRALSPFAADAAAGVMREMHAALLDSVRHHVVADVPVGAFLSAGVDSGALLGLMRDAGQQDIQAVTLAFGELRGSAEDEVPLAQAVARHYGVRHATRLVTEAEFNADLPAIVDAMDQPSIDGINVWFAAKAARELGLKVAISGLGGDELLGGYPSFRDIPRWVRLLAVPAHVPFLGKAARMGAQPIARLLGGNPKAPGLIELGGSYPSAYLLRRGLFMPWELGEVLPPDVAAEGLRRLAPLQLIAEAIAPRPRAAHAKVAALEASLYLRNQLLRDADWAGMAHGVEVRVPLVDAFLLRKVANAQSALRWGRARLLGAALALSPRRPLPESVLTRAKTGFATPIAGWLQARGLPEPVAPRREVPAAAHWTRQWAERLAIV